MARAFFILFFCFSIQAYCQCIKGNCHNGYGTYIFDNSDQYIGNWSKGKQNGKGTYIWVNGDKYIGDFKDGLRFNLGTYDWKTGEKYTGEWDNDERNGWGTFIWADGAKYTGKWKDDEIMTPDTKVLQDVQLKGEIKTDPPTKGK